MITNACATQAIVSVLLNCNHEDLQLGSTLGEFKEFAQGFDPQVRRSLRHGNRTTASPFFRFSYEVLHCRIVIKFVMFITALLGERLLVVQQQKTIDLLDIQPATIRNRIPRR